MYKRSIFIVSICLICVMMVSSALALSTTTERLLTPDTFLFHFQRYAQDFVDYLSNNGAAALQEEAIEYITITDKWSDPEKSRITYTNKDQSIKLVFDGADIKDSNKPGTRVIFMAGRVSEKVLYEAAAKTVFGMTVNLLMPNIEYETITELLSMTTPGYLDLDDGYKLFNLAESDRLIYDISLSLTE